MQFRNRDVWVEEGALIIVPATVEHRPVAEEEAHVLLLGEPFHTWKLIAGLLVIGGLAINLLGPQLFKKG